MKQCRSYCPSSAIRLLQTRMDPACCHCCRCKWKVFSEQTNHQTPALTLTQTTSRSSSWIKNTSFYLSFFWLPVLFFPAASILCTKQSRLSSRSLVLHRARLLLNPACI